MARLIIALLCALAAPAHALMLEARPGVARALAAARCTTLKAQLAPAPLKTRQKTTYTTDGGGGGKGGGAPGAQIAKPKRKAHTEEVPLYKVLLLGDSEYEEDPVRTRRRHCSLARPL